MNTSRPAARSRRLLALTLALTAYLTGCGGDSGSSRSPGPDPTIQNVLVYQDAVAEGQPMSLYVLNREGEARRLSEDTGGATVQNYAVSPDGSQVAYWYSLGERELALVMIALNDPKARPTRLVIEDTPSGLAMEGWLQWLPDSRRVLYTTARLGGGYGNSLWLASVGKKNPVQLLAAEPDVYTYLAYAVSADGSRLAVTADYLDAQDCCNVVSTSLYLLDMKTLEEPLLIDSTSGDAASFQLDWSPSGHELLFQRRVRYRNPYTYTGPLMLLGADGRSFSLREGDNGPGSHWLDPGRVVVGLQNGFEVVGTDSRVLASHVGTGTQPDRGAGAVSITASPDGRLLAFLDWTTEMDLEVYLLDMETGETRVVGPASSQPIIWHTPGGVRYDVSGLYWSRDGSWLAWDMQTLTPEQSYVYAHEVATSGTRMVAMDARFFLDLGGYPWLPGGNALEYQFRTESGNTFYALEADDLDSGQPLFVAPYPMPSLAVTDSQLGEPLTVAPFYFCNRAWLGNGKVFWNGCDGNTYLSRIAGQTLDDTLLIARGTAWLTLSSRNRELFLLSPVYPDTSWQMYDYERDRLLTLSGTISFYHYTMLM